MLSPDITNNGPVFPISMPGMFICTGDGLAMGIGIFIFGSGEACGLGEAIGICIDSGDTFGFGEAAGVGDGEGIFMPGISCAFPCVDIARIKSSIGSDSEPSFSLSVLRINHFPKLRLNRARPE